MMRTQRRSWTKGALCRFLAAVLCFLAADSFAQDPGKADEAAVVVNGSPIANRMVEQEMQRMVVDRMEQNELVAPEEGMRMEILHRLIVRELLLQESRKRGIAIEPAVVSETVERLRGRYDSPEAFRTRLRAMDLTEEEFRRRVADDLAVKQLIEKHIVRNRPIPEDRIRRFYEENPQWFERPDSGQPVPLEQARADIARQLQRQEAREQLDRYVQRLKGEADIRFPGGEASEGTP